MIHFVVTPVFGQLEEDRLDEPARFVGELSYGTASKVQLGGEAAGWVPPGISMGEAAAELGIANNTVSTLVIGLAERGLSLRQADADDRRLVRLRLTRA
jgi:hypothetical protein